MNEEITCKKCTCKEYKTELSGQHLKAVCACCEAYIKFLPQNNTVERMPFGQYKNTPIKEITDKRYLEWMLSQGNVKGGLKLAIENRVKHLR